jgi:hypothetical protein
MINSFLAKEDLGTYEFGGPGAKDAVFRYMRVWINDSTAGPQPLNATAAELGFEKVIFFFHYTTDTPVAKTPVFAAGVPPTQPTFTSFQFVVSVDEGPYKNKVYSDFLVFGILKH